VYSLIYAVNGSIFNSFLHKSIMVLPPRDKTKEKKAGKGGAKRRKSLEERAFERIELRKELKRLEVMIEELKIDYEQFFLGITPFQPDKLHNAVKQLIREIRKAPFKKSAHKYRQLTLESRYHTYNDYWQRVLRQKEEGTYSKDVFKANLRERNALEDQEAGTLKGEAAKNMQALFKSYKSALEKQTGKKQDLDYKAFQKSLVKRAKAYKEKYGDQKLTFKVTVKEGKVTIKAKGKSDGESAKK
jgi:hypothetical protein